MTTFSSDQITVGQQVIGVVKSLGLSPEDTKLAELDAIEAGLAESDLANIGYGDYPSSMGGQMSSSRGVFQQIAAWGPLADRTNVAKATQMFLQGGQAGQRGLLDVPGWNTQPSYQAVQAVQGSEFSDGSNYRDRMAAAQQFLQSYADGAPPAAPGSVAPSAGGGTTAQPAANTTAGAQNANWITDVLGGPVPGLLWSQVGAQAGAAGGNALSGILSFAVESVFAVAGLGLVVLGAWRMSAPARSKVESAAQSIPVPVPV